MLVQPGCRRRLVARLWDRVSLGARAYLAPLRLLLLVALLCVPDLSRAQEFQVPTLQLAPDVSAYEGRRVVEFLLQEDRSSPKPLKLRWARLGELLTGETVRRAMRELLETGRYAQVSARLNSLPNGVRVTIVAERRRIVAGLEIIGGVLDEELTFREANISLGDEITAATVSVRVDLVRQLYIKRGYRSAQITSELMDTDNPLDALLVFRVRPGRPSEIAERRFQVQSTDSKLRQQLSTYSVAKGDVADEERLEAADRLLERRLIRAGWLSSRVEHQLASGEQPALVVTVEPGPLVAVRLEGNQEFRTPALLDAVGLSDIENLSPEVVAKRVRKVYLDRGFIDAQVKVKVVGDEQEQFWRMLIREGRPLHVVKRRFPCLAAEVPRRDVLSELDGVLSARSEERRDLKPLLRPQDVDARFQWTKKRPLELVPLPPWERYVETDYEAAAEHLQDLYRADGYLTALVGPARLVRRTCRKGSPPGECIPIEPRSPKVATCPSIEAPVPIAEPPVARGAFCSPDYVTGKYCEPDAFVDIPVKLGPRALLWDLRFEGNRSLSEAKLQELAALRLGAPLSQLSLQEARRKLIEAYQDLGYAFASVEVELELSQDKTRGRALFVIAEREAVSVRSIVVRGAKRTQHSVILGRLEFGLGDVYERQLVRQSERQIATLGAFSSVNILLEDPEVPAREKVVIVEVEERAPQYLDIKPGFSTGDGFRAAFEYGHRNLFGRAIQLRLRLQLGFLPGTFILEEEVQNQLERLSLD